ncbi:MAG: FAD-dependent oxidoreductase [Spirochaetales bacterium]|nr:FAD-dependent oxidoreductase [Spirochaetales bacterium]
MRIIVIGAVAAGTSAAAKARRNNDFAEIVIYEKDIDISYSGCGLPYYIGGEVTDINELTPRDAVFFKKKYDILVKTQHEVMGIDPVEKTLKVKNLVSDEIISDSYDILIMATGASSFIPPIPGIEKSHVFSLRNVQNALKIKEYINTFKPKHAVIAGTGFIGFEVLENLMNLNIDVTIVEVADKITPNLDKDMAVYLENILQKKGCKIIKSTSISSIEENKVILSNKKEISADMVIMATGVRPNIKLAKEIGLEIGATGAIKVDNKMKTSIDNIYACGDCIETYSSITGKPVYRPLGSTANKTGRIAGDVVTGGSLEYMGNLSTGIFKLFDLAIASTGLSQNEAIDEGFDIVISHNIKPDKPAYFNGEEMVIKTIADKKTHRILGVQIIGTDGVDKRIDVFATLITYKAKVEELFHLDLAYAPPFSTTKDPVHYSGMILNNELNNERKIKTSSEIRGLESYYQIIDARSSDDYQKKGYVDCAINIPHGKLRDSIRNLDPEKPTITYCNKGVTGNAAQNILINHGFKEVYNLSGGHKFYKSSKEIKGE